MANKKLLLVSALGATVLLALFLFTRDGVQPDRKPPRPGAHARNPRAAEANRASQEHLQRQRVKRLKRSTPGQKSPRSKAPLNPQPHRP